MANVIVIFASNPQAEMPLMGASDRAAIGLAVSRFTDPVAGFCPQRDQVAANYGAAAKIVKVEPLPSQIPIFDIAIVGLSALSEFGDELAGVLAEKRNATLVFDVLDVHRDGDQLRIIKDIGQGNREEWVVNGAVVMVISANAVRPPYVSRYRRMMAARNRTENEVQTPAKPATEWEGVRPRVKLSRGAQSYGGLAEDRHECGVWNFGRELIGCQRPVDRCRCGHVRTSLNEIFSSSRIFAGEFVQIAARSGREVGRRTIAKATGNP